MAKKKATKTTSKKKQVEGEELPETEIETKPKHPGGRPSKYRPEFVEEAFKLTLLHATDEQIAGFFDVDVATLHRWKNEHPEFCDSLKNGKLKADREIADSLFQRAKGYRWIEEQAIKRKVDKDLEEVVVIKVERVVPPDTTACIFWLKNRQKDQWRDKVDHEVTGKDGGAIQTEDITERDPIDVARRIAFLLNNAARGLDTQPKSEDKPKDKGK